MLPHFNFPFEMLPNVPPEKRSKYYLPLMLFAVVLLLGIVGFIVWGLFF